MTIDYFSYALDLANQAGSLPSPVEFVRCTACNAPYSLDDFLALPLPCSGRGRADGLIWRNCHCGGTFTIEDPPRPNPSPVAGRDEGEGGAHALPSSDSE